MPSSIFTINLHICVCRLNEQEVQLGSTSAYVDLQVERVMQEAKSEGGRRVSMAPDVHYAQHLCNTVYSGHPTAMGASSNVSHLETLTERPSRCEGNPRTLWERIGAWNRESVHGTGGAAAWNPSAWDGLHGTCAWNRPRPRLRSALLGSSAWSGHRSCIVQPCTLDHELVLCAAWEQCMVRVQVLHSTAMHSGPWTCSVRCLGAVHGPGTGPAYYFPPMPLSLHVPRPPRAPAGRMAVARVA